jgi:hemoglobin
LDHPEAIELMVDSFYSRIKTDPRLSVIFFELGEVELEKHLPHIKCYWKKLLLADHAYNRHTMNIHRALHEKVNLRSSDFEIWLALFIETIDDGFSGPMAKRAKKIASSVAGNMASRFKMDLD